MELKVGDMVKMSNESSKDASNQTDVFELKAIIDGYFIGKDIKYGDVVSYEYAVPAVPEKQEPEVVDVEVNQDRLTASCPFCGNAHQLHKLYKDPHYAGIVWKDASNELLNNNSVMWRGETGYLYSHKIQKNDKLERASKVRFMKGGE